LRAKALQINQAAAMIAELRASQPKAGAAVVFDRQATANCSKPRAANVGASQRFHFNRAKTGPSIAVTASRPANHTAKPPRICPGTLTTLPPKTTRQRIVNMLVGVFLAYKGLSRA
jgi:hypothetical protein